MPLRDPRKYLFDIVSGCEFLLEFTGARSLADYQADRAFRSAVERELQIIGEAMMQLDRHFPDLSQRISDHQNIIGFRHVLVHGYDSLNPKTVWNVVETKLRLLLKESHELLQVL
jgi:uncharacterized protein with HEPN domain